MLVKKKRKDDNHKEFAVGTKIEYNNKLYEVIESNSCVDCSIASICPSSNISGGIDIGSTLFRNKRINIFGECSSLKRLDKKSVVFVEISKDDSKDNSKYECYKISPLWVYNNPTQLRPIELVLPKGYVIDKEHSDLDKGIIRFKSKWLTLEQIYNLAKATNYHTYLSEIKDYTDDKSCTIRDKLIALANLMDIASYFNAGWEYDVTEEVVGYSIGYYKFVKKPHYSVCKLDASFYTYYGSPVFKNKDDAQYVIDNPNFRDILYNIFKV